ncbi:hypothetical protein D187_009163 [Cystobacter fuscus DSM 2262]|uniref:DUF4097 domain-containing protein n=1 Tax=Cystobacter fuscus (strain ATCC 25194 / DSM 2262 / NBRC 100088 / M29) TaxID=1242864 RepID=S9NZW5_CYSF2|nr:DUF4097 family beta strand repeat-containing protein [Cystobacter fuscus]EPX55552.1 hypothetical protein D187_009163 [Cystobacter fuscus DSM 2262]
MLSTALIVVLASAPAPASWRFEAGATPEVSLSAINGSIQVEAVEGQTVSVEARREDGADVKPFLDVEHDGDEVSVSVCCGPCEEGRASRCDNPVPVHLVVKLPRGSELEVSAVGAPVKVTGVTGSLEVNTVSGDVSLLGSRGRLEVATVDGSVELRPDDLEDTEVSTVSGNVKLKLPRDAGAQVEFSSVGGRFNGSGVSLGSIERRYGNGGSAVEVNTVSGSFDLQSDAATN